MFFLREEQIAEEAFPVGWDKEILRAVKKHGKVVVLDGQSPTSIPGDAPSAITILDGDQIATLLPWLDFMYGSHFRNIAQHLSHRTLYAANQRISGINANLLCGVGATYEKHRDSNPVTALLFANSLSDTDGGELIFEADSGDLCVRPKKGLFLAFDARATVHYVAPLRREMYRVSLPMNFYESETDQYRPDGLSEYLYTV